QLHAFPTRRPSDLDARDDPRRVPPLHVVRVVVVRLADVVTTGPRATRGATPFARAPLLLRLREELGGHPTQEVTAPLQGPGGNPPLLVEVPDVGPLPRLLQDLEGRVPTGTDLRQTLVRRRQAAPDGLEPIRVRPVTDSHGDLLPRPWPCVVRQVRQRAASRSMGSTAHGPSGTGDVA